VVAQLSSHKLIRINSRSRYFLAVVVLSVLAHGVVLGLPWPATEAPEEPPATAAERDPSAMMDVAILPADRLRPAVEAAIEPTPSEAPPAPGPVVEPPPPPPTNSPPPPSQPVTTPPPTPTEPPTDPTPPGPDPLNELPPEPGSSGLTSPPPTFQEPLQDPGEYQYDGTKNLGDATITISQSWAVEGQVLPEKVATLELPYELETTCLDEPPLRGTLMVVTDEVGNFVRGPEVISSTGYAILDEQAEEFVSEGQYRLPEDFEAKAYSVDIEVLYPQACL